MEALIGADGVLWMVGLLLLLATGLAAALLTAVRGGPGRRTRHPS